MVFDTSIVWPLSPRQSKEQHCNKSKFLKNEFLHFSNNIGHNAFFLELKIIWKINISSFDGIKMINDNYK